MATPQAGIYGDRINHEGVWRGAKANDLQKLKGGTRASRRPLPWGKQIGFGPP